MFVNVCDHPMSFYSSHARDRGGFPILSVRFAANALDIPIPDPLDLTQAHLPDLGQQASRHAGM